MLANPYVWLSELMEDADLLNAPKAIVPRLAWKERVTLLAAREKGGKSTLASAAAAAVSSGSAFLGVETEPGTVLIIALEEHPADFAPRLMNFGADPTKIAIVNANAKGKSLVETIKAAAEEVKPSLIIWDTLGAFAHRMTGGELESGDAQGWTTIMTHITEIAREFGATLILHHSRKSDGKYRDSTAIGANVDVILEMHGEFNTPRTIKGQGRFQIEETRILLENNTYRLLETPSQLQQKIVDFVKTNPKTSWKNLQRNLPGSPNDLMTAKNELLTQGRIINVGTSLNHEYIAK